MHRWLSGLLVGIALLLSLTGGGSAQSQLLPVLARGSTIVVKAATGNTAAITTTSLLANPPAIGVYKLTYYIVVTATGTSTNVVATFGWTDPAAARTATASTVSCAATNTTSGSVVIVPSGSTVAITYATSLTGTCTYSVYLTLERLS